MSGNHDIGAVFDALEAICEVICKNDTKIITNNVSSDVCNSKSLNVLSINEHFSEGEESLEFGECNTLSSPASHSIGGDSTIVFNQELKTTDKATTFFHDTLNNEIEELFEQMKRKKFCFTTMNTIAERCRIILRTENFTISEEMFRTAADRLILAVEEIDIRVQTNYLNLFCYLFMFTHDFNSAMRYFFDIHAKLHSSNSECALPILHRFFTKYEKNYSKLMQRFNEHDSISSVRLVKMLAFLLMISPRATLRKIILDYVRKSSINIIQIAKAMRKIPAFFELKLPVIGIQGKSGSVIIALIYRFLYIFTNSVSAKSQPDVDFNNSNQYNRLLSVLSILSTTRTNISTGEYLFKSVLDPNEIMTNLICQQLSPDSSHLPISLNFTLDLFSKLLEKRSNGFTQDESLIYWKNTSDIQSNIGVDIGLVTHYLINLCMTKSVDPSIKTKCMNLYIKLFEITREKSGLKMPKSVNNGGGHSRHQNKNNNDNNGQPELINRVVLTRTISSPSFIVQGQLNSVTNINQPPPPLPNAVASDYGKPPAIFQLARSVHTPTAVQTDPVSNRNQSNSRIERANQSSKERKFSSQQCQSCNHNNQNMFIEHLISATNHLQRVLNNNNVLNEMSQSNLQNQESDLTNKKYERRDNANTVSIETQSQQNKNERNSRSSAICFNASRNKYQQQGTSDTNRQRNESKCQTGSLPTDTVTKDSRHYKREIYKPPAVRRDHHFLRRKVRRQSNE